MICGRVIVIVGMLAFAAGSQSQEMKVKQPAVKSCRQVVSTRPGDGPAYKGTVANSDYDFSAQVPQGLTAWGGVAESAPFHGFTIFLDSKAESCIVFEVHIRVDENETAVPRSRSKSILLGKVEGWQTSHTGVIDGIKLTNVQTRFSFRQPDQIDDGSILLVTPSSNAVDALRNYDSFLHNLVFGH
jgi:hypothetical protein